jgi:hypothetical protein
MFTYIDKTTQTSVASSTIKGISRATGINCNTLKNYIQGRKYAETEAFIIVCADLYRGTVITRSTHSILADEYTTKKTIKQ